MLLLLLVNIERMAETMCTRLGLYYDTSRRNRSYAATEEVQTSDVFGPLMRRTLWSFNRLVSLWREPRSELGNGCQIWRLAFAGLHLPSLSLTHAIIKQICTAPAQSMDSSNTKTEPYQPPRTCNIAFLKIYSTTIWVLFEEALFLLVVAESFKTLSKMSQRRWSETGAWDVLPTRLHR